MTFIDCNSLRGEPKDHGVAALWMHSLIDPSQRYSPFNNGVGSGDALALGKAPDLFGNILDRGQPLQRRSLTRFLDLFLGKALAPVLTRKFSKVLAKGISSIGWHFTSE